MLGLKWNEFDAYYQPVMNVAHGYCSGVEILVRWRHTSDGIISPEVFVPLAEISGLILPLTNGPFDGASGGRSGAAL